MCIPNRASKHIYQKLTRRSREMAQKQKQKWMNHKYSWRSYHSFLVIDGTDRWPVGTKNTACAHDFNPSTWEVEVGDSPQFEASLVYTVSFRPAILPSKALSQKTKQNKTKKHPPSKTNTAKSKTNTPSLTDCLTIMEHQCSATPEHTFFAHTCVTVSKIEHNSGSWSVTQQTWGLKSHGVSDCRWTKLEIKWEKSSPLTKCTDIIRQFSK